MWVSPFRYPRIIKYLLLPVAFRSLSRLSSALSAKASTLRSYQLNLLTRGAGCSPHLRLQRQTLRSWFITLASSSYLYNEVFSKIVRFSSRKHLCSLVLPLVLDVSIFYRFRSEQICSFVVFGFQGTFYILTVLSVIITHNLLCAIITNNSLFFLERVEMERFELLTPCLQGRCSPN